MNSEIPWWVRILVGVAGIGILWYLYPLLDLVWIFWVFVGVPLTALVCLLFIGGGTFDAVSTYVPDIINNLRNRIDTYREDLGDAQENPS